MPNRYRCTAGAIVLFPVLTLPLTAQDPKPHVAVTGGLGNVLGGLGAGVEYYLAGSRISASGGLGFWPAGCDQATFAGAGALRGFAAISCAVFAEDVERHTVQDYRWATDTSDRTGSRSPRREGSATPLATTGPKPSSSWAWVTPGGVRTASTATHQLLLTRKHGRHGACTERATPASKR
jgi:hypothetical protein